MHSAFHDLGWLRSRGGHSVIAVLAVSDSFCVCHASSIRIVCSLRPTLCI